MDKNIVGEKIAFVLHKIVFGAVYYAASTFLYKVHNAALKLKDGVVQDCGMQFLDQNNMAVR